MQRSVCAIVVVLAAGTARSYAIDDGGAKSPAAAPDVQSASSGRTAGPVAQDTTIAASDPRVVVHEQATAPDARDGRVQVGDIRISMASWSAPATNARGSEGADSGAAKPDGQIDVPSNTLGPGEPLWRTRERQDAERKILEARVDLERARAERAQNDSDRDRHYGFFGGTIFSPVWSGRHNGLYGPVTTTVTRFDDLGSTAQRAFADAAYPRLNGTTDARDRAVSRFGRDATPPIVRIQNDVDRAHTNAFKEHAKPSR